MHGPGYATPAGVHRPVFLCCLTLKSEHPALSQKQMQARATVCNQQQLPIQRDNISMYELDPYAVQPTPTPVNASVTQQRAASTACIACNSNSKRGRLNAAKQCRQRQHPTRMHLAQLHTAAARW